MKCWWDPRPFYLNWDYHKTKKMQFYFTLKIISDCLIMCLTSSHQYGFNFTLKLSTTSYSRIFFTVETLPIDVNDIWHLIKKWSTFSVFTSYTLYVAHFCLLFVMSLIHSIFRTAWIGILYTVFKWLCFVISLSRLQRAAKKWL